MPTDGLSRLVGFSDAAEQITERIKEVSAELRRSNYWLEAINANDQLVERVTSDLVSLHSRLEEIIDLAVGWFDGEGVEISRHIARSAETLMQYLLYRDVPRPRVYPTLEGGIQMEWTFVSQEVSLTVQSNAWICALKVDTSTGEAREAEFESLNAASIAGLVLDPY
jgi:hypothetical protein